MKKLMIVMLGSSNLGFGIVSDNDDEGSMGNVWINYS